MKLGRRFPHLSLVVAGTEIYPLIVREVTRRALHKSSRDAGSSDIEDFLSEAVLRVLSTTKRRYHGRTKITTFVYKRLGGSFLDMMRKEMRYANKMTLAADCPDGQLPDMENTVNLEASLNNRLLFMKVRTVMRETLTPTEREILLRVYWQGDTLAGIAEDLWMEHKECTEAHGAALARIRASFPNRRGAFFVS